MQTASGLPIRKQIRLRGFHYGGGCAYYVTVCAFEKRLLFGSCADGIVVLNAVGAIVRSSWMATEALRPGIVLDDFQIMPNHIHAILHLPVSFRRNALFTIIGGFKAQVTSLVRVHLQNPDFMVWQKRFNDRIIRTQRELELIREYIRTNPERWCGTAQPCPTLLA